MGAACAARHVPGKKGTLAEQNTGTLLLILLLGWRQGPCATKSTT